MEATSPGQREDRVSDDRQRLHVPSLGTRSGRGALGQRRRQRNSSDAGEDEHKGAASSAANSAPLSPPTSIGSQTGVLHNSSDDKEDEEEEKKEHVLAPPKVNAASTINQTAAGATPASLSATKLSFLPQSALLKRLTRQPSPVPIPPNSIGLTYLHEFFTNSCPRRNAQS
jgi:hypothetical protein